MAEEKRSTQENEFEESQTNDTEKEEVNSEKHQGEAHKKKEDKQLKHIEKQGGLYYTVYTKISARDCDS